VIDVQAEPFGGTSIYAQHRVFRLAHEAGIKVMLDGQGPDEMFAGYRSYLPTRVAGLLFRGRFLTAARFAAALSRLPGESPSSVVRGVLRDSAAAARGSLPERIRTPAYRLTWRKRLPDWLDGAWLAAHDVVVPGPAQTVAATADLQARLGEDVRSSLRTLLRYEDRNSMAFSIESRVPYVTPAIVEFAAGLPDDYLIAPDGIGKLVLRRSLRGLVPDPILDRRDKIGFTTPEAAWLISLGSWVDTVLDSDAAHAAGPLRVEEARLRWQAMRDTTNAFDRTTAWRWLNFVRWIDRFAVEVD
jgi:asparagine synthase (glutamine-hydrolysing)